jgi:hypothetical protein
VPQDGIVGPGTQQAIAQFQMQQQLPPTEVLDDTTLEALQAACDGRPEALPAGEIPDSEAESATDAGAGCSYDLRQALQIELPAARATLERSRQVAERFIGSYGALSARGRFTKTVLDDKYWFAKLYEYITYYEIEMSRTGQFQQPGFVLHFIPIFYGMYADALDKYLSGNKTAVHKMWAAHFSTAARPKTGSASAWIGGVVASIKTGVAAHIRGDMAGALEQGYRSYVSKYCLSNPPFDTFKRDFFDTMKPVFEKAKAALLLDVSQLGPFPVGPEVGQFILATGEQTFGGGLSTNEIYSWREEGWQKARRNLGQ